MTEQTLRACREPFCAREPDWPRIHCDEHVRKAAEDDQRYRHGRAELHCDCAEPDADAPTCTRCGYRHRDRNRVDHTSKYYPPVIVPEDERILGSVFSVSAQAGEPCYQDGLVGVNEAARIAGVTRSAVVKAHERGTMPAPVPVAGSQVLVWRRADVEEWAATRRKPGRPRAS